MCADLKFFWKLMNIWTSAVWKAFRQKSWKGFLMENLFSNFQFLKKHFPPPLHPLKLNCSGCYSTWTVRGAAQLGISADTEVSLRGCRGGCGISSNHVFQHFITPQLETTARVLTNFLKNAKIDFQSIVTLKCGTRETYKTAAKYLKYSGPGARELKTFRLTYFWRLSTMK